MLEAIERLYRRIMLMIGIGKVTTGNDGGAVQMLQIQLGADEVRDNTPRVAEFGFTSMPPPGSDAVLAFLRGDRSSGIVIATGNQTYRLKNLATGEVALYDAFGKYVKLSQTGIVVEAAGQSVTVNNASTVVVNATTSVTLNTPQTHMTGALTVDGAVVMKSTVEADGAVTMKSTASVAAMATVGGLAATGVAGASTVAGNISITGGDVTADGISLKTHVHGGVQTGSGNTAGPH
jgi:phage baseplate assembly protein V